MHSVLCSFYYMNILHKHNIFLLQCNVYFRYGLGYSVAVFGLHRTMPLWIIICRLRECDKLCEILSSFTQNSMSRCSRCISIFFSLFFSESLGRFLFPVDTFLLISKLQRPMSCAFFFLNILLFFFQSSVVMSCDLSLFLITIWHQMNI